MNDSKQIELISDSETLQQRVMKKGAAKSFCSKVEQYNKIGCCQIFLQQHRIVQPKEALQNPTVAWLP